MLFQATTVLACLAALAPSTYGQSAFPSPTPGIDIGTALPGGFEPSGAAWHQRLQLLFVIDDSGNLTSMDASGAIQQTWPIGGDLEGVCVADPQSSLVYIAREHPDGIIEFDLSSGTAKRLFNLTGTLVGPNDRGLEALTFVRDPSHAEGGLFYAGLQQDGRVYVFELPIASSTTATSSTLQSVLSPAPGLDDISGLTWDAASDQLYACYDKHDIITALSQAGATISTWDLPSDKQEGLALRGCQLFVAQDSGEVLRYESFPTSAACATANTSVTAISVSAGGSQPIHFNFGPSQANKTYIMLGTLSGTLPGVDFGSIHVPLQPDGYLNFTLTHTNTPLLASSLGTLGQNGEGTATINLPPGLGPSFVGLKFYHAIIALTATVQAASNPIPLTLVP